MRSFVFLTAFVIGGLWYALEHPLESASADPVHASRPDEVQSVVLDGRGLPRLTDLLATRSGDLLDDTKLALDRRALQEALIARGYLLARVAAPQIVHDDEGGVFVTFPIAQGPQFRVRSVTVTGATAKAAGVVTVVRGDIAMADRIEHARAALARRLSRDVVARVAPDVGAAAVDIELSAR